MLTPQKLQIISLSSYNHRFARSPNGLPAISPCLMFKLTSYQSPTKWLPSSRAPFEPIENRKMTFRWICSNSRGLSSKSSYILHPNRRYFKGWLLIFFLSTWSVLPIKLENDKSAGLWMVKARSCWLCFRFYLGHLMVTFDIKVWSWRF